MSGHDVTEHDVISEPDRTTAVATAGTVAPSWSEAFGAVDRGAFVPARAWVDDVDGRPAPIDRDTDPARWQTAVYSDEPIVTQLDEGRIQWPATSLLVTSSASQPSMVARMLEALHVEDGYRVLEIGTGTGYNTALLCARLGADRVTSVEVDPLVAAQARGALAAAGYRPRLVCGDGAAGWPADAPYDRVLCTAAVASGRLPVAWIEQIRPGGHILSPWGTAYYNGVLVDLTVHEDGTAAGPIIGEAAFMRLRAHDTPFGHAARLGDVLDASTTAAETTTIIPPAELATGDGAFTVGLHLPDVQAGLFHDDGNDEVLLYHVPTGSVASALVTPQSATAGRYPVRQHGPRRLWDEASAAYTWWTGRGRPAPTRYGITVSPTHQHVWLDDPAGIITPNITAGAVSSAA